MHSRTIRVVSSLATASLGTALACGSTEGPVLAGAGEGDDAGGSSSGAGGPVPGGRFDGGGAGFSVDVENAAHVVLTTATVSCAGGCVDVQAVPQGGSPPYVYAWSDGSTAATRHICPTATTTVSVSVNDAGVTSGELSRPPQKAKATLAIEVLGCPDAATPDASAPGPLCISNPSLEGTAGLAITQLDAPPWTSCMLGAGYANIYNGAQLDGMAASDGNTYLRLAVDATDSTVVSASEALCAPLHAQTPYSLLVDLAEEVQDSVVPPWLEIWGGSSSCASGERLWSSPMISGAAWKTYCATLTPTRETGYLTFVLGAPAGQFAVLAVDHLVPVARCQ